MFGPRKPGRAVIGAVVLYIGLAAAFVSPALRAGKTLSGSDVLWVTAPWAALRPAGFTRATNVELYDAATQYEPWQRYTSSRLPSIPLWDPFIMGGRPFLANAQSAVFSLFSLPAHLLPFGLALPMAAMLKLVVAAVGTFLACRALGISPPGAFLAGVTYAFGLYQITNISWPFTSVWVLIPWLMLCAETCLWRPSPRAAASLATVVGLQFFSGHPESSFHALVATTLFFLVRLIHLQRSHRTPVTALWSRILAFILGGAGGFALAANVLFPFFELVLRSSDLAERSGGSGLPSRVLVMLFMPDWWGRPTGVVFGDYPAFFFCRALYTGALPLMLAAVAVLLQPSFQRLALMVLASWILAIVAGIYHPVAVANSLPGFRNANNLRLIILFLFAVALLAGKGVDELTHRRVSRFRAVLAVTVCFALLCVPLVWVGDVNVSAANMPLALKTAWSLVPETWEGPEIGASTTRLASAIRWLAVGGVSWALLVARLGLGLRPRCFATLAAVVVTADLFHIGIGYNPAIDRALLVPPVTNGIKYLQSRRPNRFVGLGPYFIIPGVLPPNLATEYGLFDVRGYDFPVERHYDRLWRTQIQPGHFLSARALGQLNEPALRALSLLSVSDIMLPLGFPAPVGPRLRIAYRGPDAIVYANDRALPRAFVTHAQRVVADEDAAFAAVTDPSFDAQGVVVTEHSFPEIPTSVPPAAFGHAEILEYQPERVVIRATSATSGILVLTDVAFPGWRAAVDDHDTEVYRVDYLLRGVPIAPGTHTVEFSYEPLSFRIGVWVSVLTLLGIGVAALCPRAICTSQSSADASSHPPY